MKIRQMNTFLQNFERSDVFMAPKVRNRVKQIVYEFLRRIHFNYMMNRMFLEQLGPRNMSKFTSRILVAQCDRIRFTGQDSYVK